MPKVPDRFIAKTMSIQLRNLPVFKFVTVEPLTMRIDIFSARKSTVEVPEQRCSRRSSKGPLIATGLLCFTLQILMSAHRMIGVFVTGKPVIRGLSACSFTPHGRVLSHEK